MISCVFVVLRTFPDVDRAKTGWNVGDLAFAQQLRDSLRDLVVVIFVELAGFRCAGVLCVY